ncbi:MAG: hypothetical protein K2P19_14580 [Kineothrix sp.]|nr:hypothetical protein [Kineothrix sp.]
MNDINEIILRNRPAREPMSFERLKFLCYFVAGIIAEVLGFGLALVIVLAMAGVFC